MDKQTMLEALTKPRLSILTVLILFLAALPIIALQVAPVNAWPAFLFNHTAEAETLPVLVNELLAHTDPPQKDTVELYNPNAQAVNVSGWYLSDALDKPKKFKIPANMVIPAHGYLLLGPDDFEIDARFVFSAEGEEIYLFAANAAGRLTGYHHGFSFGASTNGVSFGRYVTSAGAEEFPLQAALTLGFANAGPRVGPVVISAIIYNPQSGDEYIELTNISTDAVPLYDPAAPENSWRILGQGDYPLPPNLTLAPGATLLIVAGEVEAFRSAYAIADNVQVIGPYPHALPDTGAKLSLYMPDPPNKDGFVPYVEVDVVEYANRSPWSIAASKGSALRRLDLNAYGNDPANWTLKEGTD